MSDYQENIVYPPGVRSITANCTGDELVKRMKKCAQAFQTMVQEEDNTAYVPLALHLASDTYLQHNNLDVRLLAACCLADVFRIYAPESPFTDSSQVKVIFEFFLEQLRGLGNTHSVYFKRRFYLLENFAYVKTFNILMDLDQCCDDIFVSLFELMFAITSSFDTNDGNRVKNTILDMLNNILSESEGCNKNILEVILLQIIEPNKSNKKSAYRLAQDLIRRSAASLENQINKFFINTLFYPSSKPNDNQKSSDKIKPCHVYELIYELNVISSTLVTEILPQLECRLKSPSLEERLQVAKIVARMFADKHSKMIVQNNSLWTCFIARFNDIDPQVRILCSEASKPILLNHPEAKDDLTEQLKPRSRDPNEDVRYAVVMAILNAAKQSFSSINEELLSFIKERTLDKKFRIRKEALSGLATLYSQHSEIGTSSELTAAEIESISWIKNKILHVYYQNSVNDRLLVERILNTCLVSYRRPTENRMKMLYKLFCTVDENAARAFTEILKCQKNLRIVMETILRLIQQNQSSERENIIHKKIIQLTKHFQDPPKANPHFIKFFSGLRNNNRLRTMLSIVLRGNITCAEAGHKVKGILASLGEPAPSNQYYFAIKQLLESVTPVMLDKEGVKYLVSFVKDSLINDGAIEAEMGLQNSSQQGLQLLLVLSYTLPLLFQTEETLGDLVLFLQVDDELASDTTLQILTNVSKDLMDNFPVVYESLTPILKHFIKTGNPKQAKHAVYCLHNIVSDKEAVFGEIVLDLKSHLTIESGYCRTALVSIGHIAYLCHDMFAPDFKHIVSGIIVKELLMLEENPENENITWGSLENLSEVTKIKIAGMKVMMRWLKGLKDMVQPTKSTLTLLSRVILQGGDLLNKQSTGPVAKSWLRLSAASCVLKLCHEPKYAAAVPLNQFQILASVMNDPCAEVRERFAQKLHKGLVSLKLPLEFMAILTLSALDSSKEFRIHVKKLLITSVGKRRAFVKDRNLSNDDLAMHLPDNAFQYAVHLLANLPFFEVYNDIPSLYKIKECLNLLLEALMFKYEDYSYAYYKRLLENIKQTKDRQNPEDENTNLKMYAVCDLALNVIMSKSNFVLKDFPAEPALNPRFFTDVDKSYNNMKTYLPPDFIKKAPVKTGFEIVAFEDPNNVTAASNTQSNSTKPKSKLRSKSTSSTLQESSVQDDMTHNSICGESNASEQTSLNLSKASECEEANSKSNYPSLLNDSNTPAISVASSEMQVEVEKPVSDANSNSKCINSGSDKTNEPKQKKQSASAISKNSPRTTGVSLRSTRSHASKSSDLSSTSPCISDTNELTVSFSSKSSPDTSSDYSHLIKECRVCLQKNEVENYTASFSSIESPMDSHKKVQNRVALPEPNDASNASCSSITSLTDENIPKRSTRSTRKSALNEESTNVLNKRKRDVSESPRSVCNRTSGSTQSTESTIPTKNTLKSAKNGWPLKEIMELQQSMPNSNRMTDSTEEADTSIKRLKRNSSPSTRSVGSRSTSSSRNTNNSPISPVSRSSNKTNVKNSRHLKEIKTIQISKNGLNNSSETPKKGSNSNKVNKEEIAIASKVHNVRKTLRSHPVSQTQRNTRQNKKIELKTNSKRR